ncbi:MAG: class I SAM-dependent methyltransferase [Bacteriovoracaceae bacterium]
MKALFIAVLLISSCGHVQKHTPQENINAKYLSPDLNVKEWESIFSKNDRDVIAFKKQILTQLNLKKNDNVADVGAGTGVFVTDLSKAVGAKGEVYAVDISPKFIEHLNHKVKKEKLSNVKVVTGEFNSTTLNANSVNVILVVDTYHHFENPALMLADFRKILKKNGRLVIVDYDKSLNSEPWLQNHIKLQKTEYIKEIESHGFSMQSQAPIPFKESFMLIFKMKDQ